jgi:FtsZ-binding cell division protein ZapB
MMMTEEVAIDKDMGSDPAIDSSAEDSQEKMLPVSRVEELVKKAKLKGRDQMQAELDALKAENAQLKTGGSMGGMAVHTPVDPEAIKQQVLADLREQMQQANTQRAQEELEREANKIADAYKAKMSTGKDTYEDFDTVMSDFNPAAFPNLVYLANQVDNTPAVMYELMKNPSKWATLAVLSERDPNAAQNMISKISASIKANEQAKADEKNVPAPLGRMSPSTTGQDNGTKSVRDFKAMFRG